MQVAGKNLQHCLNRTAAGTRPPFRCGHAYFIGRLSHGLCTAGRFIPFSPGSSARSVICGNLPTKINELSGSDWCNLSRSVRCETRREARAQTAETNFSQTR
ncbi:hypothetical protein J6590_016302 [Homalodisca vitripennis]|nr:hypothetical protein J6590_016302 [Homalodisca vitripennis]